MSDPILVPMERLSAEALLGLIDAFVLREGTDYGHEDISIDAKRASVRRQLDRGDVVIAFDPETEGVNLVLARDLR